MRLELQLSSPVLRDNPRALAAAARGLLEVTIAVNLAHLAEYRTPRLYESGVRYRLEPDDREIVCDLEQVLEQGWGDCAMLAAWRVAELRQDGEAATTAIKWRKKVPGQPQLFHVVVRRQDGRIEDPSVRLGMWSGDGHRLHEKPVVGYRRKQG